MIAWLHWVLRSWQELFRDMVKEYTIGADPAAIHTGWKFRVAPSLRSPTSSARGKQREQRL